MEEQSQDQAPETHPDTTAFDAPATGGSDAATPADADGQWQTDAAPTAAEQAEASEVVVEDVQPEEPAEQAAGTDQASLPAAPALDPAGSVEAILFAADSALTAARIAQIAQIAGQKSVKEIIAALNAKYEQMGCAFRIDAIAGGYQMLTEPQYAEVLKRLYKVRGETKLTGASLECLSIVAYKQPILRADVEAIRGVASGEVLRTLMERQMVKIVGRAELVGRPMLYGTTKRFLEVFGLANLEDLPNAEELRGLWTDPNKPVAAEATQAPAQTAEPAQSPTEGAQPDTATSGTPSDIPPEAPAQEPSDDTPPA